MVEHPAQLVGEQDERGHGRRVVGLVLAAVVEGDAEVERRRAPPVGPAAMRSMRSTAAGEQAAIHSPPSAAKHFCGAK